MTVNILCLIYLKNVMKLMTDSFVLSMKVTGGYM